VTALLGLKSGVMLLDDVPLFNRMAARIVRDHGVDRATAGNILDQAIIFVRAGSCQARASAVRYRRSGRCS
jgi:hypothetical protein